MKKCPHMSLSHYDCTRPDGLKYTLVICRRCGGHGYRGGHFPGISHPGLPAIKDPMSVAPWVTPAMTPMTPKEQRARRAKLGLT